MSNYDYDLFVLGAGSGGVRAARMAAGFGARVGVAEERYLGGTCVNVGCVPKKLFVYAAHFAEDFADAAGYGWHVDRSGFDWTTLRTNKNREIARLNGIYEKILEDAGVDILRHRATVSGAHEVSVDGRRITARYILVATGGWPTVPDVDGRELAITSNEAFFLDQLPERVTIVGGGYIAVEFAGIFNGLGCDTTLIYRGPLFMRGFDDDLRAILAEEMSKKGVNLEFDTQVKRIRPASEGLEIALSNGDSRTTGLVMYATGRAPLSRGLGLEELGVELRDNGAIVVDDNYQTSVSSIFAIGDVTDRVQLTPVALAEGMVVARRLFDADSREVDYEFIPTAVFSQPNLGTVGYGEREARDLFGDVTIYKSRFTPLKATMTTSDETTFMKLIVADRDDRVVGVHMIGADAGETIQGMAVALRAGATKRTFDTTIGIHPTAAEEFVTMRDPVRA